MYTNKALKRTYIFAYIMAIFGTVIPGYLAVKVNIGLSIFFLVLALIDLAGLIVAHVFYSKNKKIYFYTSLAAIGLFIILGLIGFLMEMIYSIQGSANGYAWVMVILDLASAGLIGTFTFFDYKESELIKFTK